MSPTLPAPTIKVASNTAMYERLQDDMDINAGRIVENGSVAQIGQEIFEAVLDVASGRATRSEQLGLGQCEFVPWIAGPTL